LALRLAGGASVRLDAGTRVRLASAVRIELERGAVYVDSGAAAGGERSPRVAVSTPAGVFEEIGTQFEVRIEADPGADPAAATTRLRVRQGRVSLDRGPGPGAGRSPLVAAAGEELEIGGDGRVVRRPAPLHGPEWGWVLATAPMLDIEGITVREFLDWVARETGWRVELADPETAAIAEATELHGSFGRLTPAEAPGPVLASCGLGYRVEGGTLVVFQSAGG
jgi:ferric-dicitrate binding protein FerR (iron transport regulator)